ncbi:aminotransferase class V-fold PLP-dependent enzyme [Trichothermofontia sp.]
MTELTNLAHNQFLAETLQPFRQQFTALATKAYFNYGGQGPLPRVALDAIIAAYETIQRLGPFSRQALLWMSQTEEQLRHAIANDLGVAPQTITLTENVTIGCNIVLWGIEWHTGDHIILSDCEHPGVVGAVRELQRRFGVEVSIGSFLDSSNQDDPIAAMVRLLRPQTRLVVLSHVLWNTGQVLPLAAMIKACRAADPTGRLQFLVDAAQSVGVLPLHLGDLDVDFYAFTGHKWWCGPEGVGGLYVRPDGLALLNPTFVGWRGIEIDPMAHPSGWKPDGRRFEIATSACPLWAGLREAIALHPGWGTPQARYHRILELATYCWQRLQELPTVSCLRTTPPESGLVAFQVANAGHEQLVKSLESHGIFLRTIRNPDCIRASLHYFTLESEIDRLIEVLQEICR